MSQSTYVYGYHAVHALLQQQPRAIQQLLVQRQLNTARSQVILALAKQHKIEWQLHSAEQIAKLLPAGVVHQGLVALASQLPHYAEHDLQHIVASAIERDEPLLLLILDGVQDPQNLGACLRTANAQGVAAVIIPKHKSASVTPVVRKVACGAVEATPVVQVTNLARCLQDLQQQGVWLVGLDAMAQLPLAEVDLKGRIGIVMGSEGQGMRRLTKQHCDFLVQIPMHGSVGSMNVASATAISLYEAQRQRAAQLVK